MIGFIWGLCTSKLLIDHSLILMLRLETFHRLSQVIYKLSELGVAFKLVR